MKFIKKFSSIEEYEAAELSYAATSLVSGTVIYDKEAPAPPTPTFEGKWLATYSDSHTESGECDSTSAITQGEINSANLESVEIGDCVTEIGDEAFYGCSSLTGITIPSSVTSVGFDAFSNCSSLPVENNIRYADTYLVEAVDKTLSTYTIKNGTRWIAPDAFSSCSSLTGITIPDSVTAIGNIAFEYCSSLTSVTIPSGVTEVGRAAFENCSSLTSVTCNPVTPPTLRGYGGSFDDTNNCPIYVPAASVNAYKNATNWSEYADRIQAIDGPAGDDGQ